MWRAVQQYGDRGEEKADSEGGENEEDADTSEKNETEGKADSGETIPLPPVEPTPLLKPSKGFVLVHQPPTQELLQAFGRVGVAFNHLIHFTNNPEDLEEAEAAGALQYALRDSEIIFEDDLEEEEADPAMTELERDIDENMELDIEVEPSKQYP